MHIPTSPVNTIQLAGAPPSALHFTSADLKPQSSIVFPPLNAGSHIGFNAFNQRAPESIHSSQSFSPWPSNPNALQLRDSNQQNLFNRSFILQKHNELGIKSNDTWKPTPPPPTRTKEKPPTWSQIAAKDPQQLTCCTSSATVMTIKSAESRISTVQAKCTVPAISLAKKDIDLDMAEASATPASPLHTAPVESPVRESRYITDSLAFISSGVNNDQNISVTRPYTVLKIKNVLCGLIHVPLFCTNLLYDTDIMECEFI